MVGQRGRGWGRGRGCAGSACQASSARVGRVGAGPPRALAPCSAAPPRLSLVALCGSFAAALCRSCCCCASFLSRVGNPMRHPLSHAQGPARSPAPCSTLLASTLPPWAGDGGRLTPQAVAASVSRGQKLLLSWRSPPDCPEHSCSGWPGLPRALLAPGPGWLCSFGVFPVCLSVCPLCLHWGPAFPRAPASWLPSPVPGPPGSAQPHGQGSHWGPEPGMQWAGPRPQRGLSSPPPRERRPAAPAGQRPAGRERHVPAAGGDGEAGGAPGPDRGARALLHLHHVPAARGGGSRGHTEPCSASPRCGQLRGPHQSQEVPRTVARAAWAGGGKGEGGVAGRGGPGG